MTLLSEAVARGEAALTEHAAKQLLSDYGIPVSREAVVPDVEAAAMAAAHMGFPVVLKASGAILQHKTEIGGVVLDLRGADEVRREGRRLLALPGCDGLLVAELVRGDREFVCGSPGIHSSVHA